MQRVLVSENEFGIVFGGISLASAYSPHHTLKDFSQMFGDVLSGVGSVSCLHTTKVVFDISEQIFHELGRT